MFYGTGEYFTGKAPFARAMGEYFQARMPPPFSGLAGSVRWNDAVLPRYSPIGRCGYGAAEGDAYRTMTPGHVAGAFAGGIVLGLAFMWVWKARKA